MTRYLAVSLFLLVTGSILIPLTCTATELPAWAYPVNPPDFKPAPDDGTVKRVPDSAAGYTLSQVRNLFAAPDWHPDDHPNMPEVVAHGRKPDVHACGFCHRADGPGGPENASLAGLPYAYIVQQLADYKSGARTTAVPKRPPQALMIALSKRITDEDVKEAAAYFASLKPRSNIRVVETDTVPQTFVANWFWADRKTGVKEPIGQRIVEVPEDLEQFELRDSRAKFVVYAPEGSVKRGEAIVTGKMPDTAPACATCHGADLRGMDATPSIAGRSPSYVVRQLHEVKSGIRAGQFAPLMKSIVAKLSLDDMISIAAYLATRAP
jgi:cytochrome c553